MRKDITSKEYFLKLLNEKNIALTKEDFEQSYLSYRNFRRNYSEIMNDDFSEYEPRQRMFDISDE
ncbi:MAG: hypothetical protein VX523_04895 [Chloroflexota bacterium]|nr:hypothetical protein [Chloroflexota bacterium]